MMKEYDTDLNSKLDKTEFKKMLTGCFKAWNQAFAGEDDKLTDDDISNAFADDDANHDGFVDFKELNQHVNQLLVNARNRVQRRESMKV